jgi:hypothetical protein
MPLRFAEDDSKNVPHNKKDIYDLQEQCFMRMYCRIANDKKWNETTTKGIIQK